MIHTDNRRRHLPLSELRLAAPAGPLAGYANRLLADLGAHTPDLPLDAVAAQAAWARSGAMALTGHVDGSPLACPAPIAACMQAACDALQTIAPQSIFIDAAPLLGERAAIAGYHRRGSVSAGGSCRLLAAQDGYIALNLARYDDWSLLPALLPELSDGVGIDDWLAVSTALLQYRIAELCDKSQLLGLAISPMDGESCARSWYEVAATGRQRKSRNPVPLVIDLSSLWAGPLCGHLLQLAGARVIKVESTSRPDGARRGPAQFFDLLNAGKQSIALNFHSTTGIAQLRALLDAADIVIESSRPRALQQFGIDAEKLVTEREGLTWISITGLGRNPAQAMRIAYGDDAGVAAGLSALLYRQYGTTVFCGDAIADPLTGAHAALAAMAAWSRGGGFLLDVALQPVVNHCLRVGTIPCGEVVRHDNAWSLLLDQQEFPVLPPRARAVTAHARSLGADTDAICRELALPC